jgi:hypothetical protein
LLVFSFENSLDSLPEGNKIEMFTRTEFCAFPLKNSNVWPQKTAKRRRQIVLLALSPRNGILKFGGLPFDYIRSLSLRGLVFSTAKHFMGSSFRHNFSPKLEIKTCRYFLLFFRALIHVSFGSIFTSVFFETQKLDTFVCVFVLGGTSNHITTNNIQKWNNGVKFATNCEIRGLVFH